MSVVDLVLPSTGRGGWRTARTSGGSGHGTDLFGGTFAIDFVGVDERGRTALTRNWRTLLATEAPERFVAPSGGRSWRRSQARWSASTAARSITKRGVLR